MSYPRLFILFLLICLYSNTVAAQSVKGHWYGIGHIQMDGISENYLTELILQQEGTIVKGEFNYYFRDSLFTNRINGSFNKQTRLLLIQKFPIIYYRSINLEKAVFCDVKGFFELRVARAGSVINGSIITASENTFLMPMINYRLIRDTSQPVKTNQANKKVTLSAFDELKSRNKRSNIISVRTQNYVLNRTTKISSSFLNHRLPNPIYPIAKIDPVVVKPTVIAEVAKPQKVEPAIIVPEAVITERAFIERKKDYAKIIDVENSTIKLEVYDNGTIDYDSVSLFLNGKMILPKSMLNHHSIKLTIDLDEKLELNELGMFAENLGMIPPNTAALIIRDGKKTYEVTLNSDFTKNAIIQLRRIKNNKKD